MVAELHWGDGVTIAVYFVVVMAVGLWSTFRANRGSTEGYFLAGKSMTWIPIGASIYASNVGAPMFIGLAGGAAASGFGVAIYEWQAIFMLLALGWVFVPVYVASGCMTMPEYLKKRFGGKRLRIYLSMLGVVLYILTKISAEMYAGALFIQQILDWNLYLSCILILAVTAIYTIAGGLAAVIYTDTLQTGILLIGAAVLMVKGLIEVGGYQALIDNYPSAAANYTITDMMENGEESNYSCGVPPKDSLHIFRGLESGFPWPGITLGLTPIALWVWCTDQVMVQRTLSAKNITHAKAGCMLAGYLKILPFFFFIWPGMISRVLYPDEIACASPDHCREVCQNPAGCTNIAYPLLVLRILPPGVRGLMLAALLAALMSSLTSIFNSASSMFTMDLWKRFRPTANTRELMLVGRLCVLILVGLSIAWIPILESAGEAQLWNYLQAVSAYIAPPWAMVFVLGVFWNRTTEQGAFWGLMVGLVVGIIRMVIDFSSPGPKCGSGVEDTRPAVLAKVHFLYFSIIISVITVLVIVIVSLLTPERPKEKMHRVTWWNRNDEEHAEVSEDEDEEDDTVEAAAEDADGDATFDVEEPTPKGPPKRSIPRIIYNWICGISDSKIPKLSKEQMEKRLDLLTSIHEKPFWRRFLNINCIICLSVTMFLLGFFG